ncbi:MAG: hypothetical protein ED559_13875 [Phycisphaera sp.]|nr:MAG: hypothetical protein ED559_13875 [Phycisphaera sp.]
MKKLTLLPVILLASTAVAIPATAIAFGGIADLPEIRQSTNDAGDADKLYHIVKRLRQELRDLRVEAGLHPHPAGPHVDPEGHHASDSPEQRRREAAEGQGHEDGEGHERGGDRGHGERERGEHGHERANLHRAIAKSAKLDRLYPNGARLSLQYNPNTEAFVGTVTNTTGRAMEDMRVEIHLSNGVELGPTRRERLAPGAAIPVELGAFGEHFSSWTTHPETGNEHGAEGENPGHEARERGEHDGRGEHGRGAGENRERGEHGREHAEGESDKPMAPGLHPVYNQLRLLQGELKAFKADLAKQE